MVWWILFDDASVQINCKAKFHGDTFNTSVRHRTKSYVVFGSSNSSVMKGAPEVIFHASVSGVDSTLTEDDLKCFLTRSTVCRKHLRCPFPLLSTDGHKIQSYGELALLFNAFSRGTLNNFCICV